MARLTEPARESFVALFDILGFRDLVEHQPIENLARIMGFIRTQAKYGKLSACQAVQFSDSVLLYTEGAKPILLGDIIAMSNHLIATSLEIGIPLRGGVTLGGFLERDGIFLGPAMVRAYDLEQSQDWAGGVVDPAIAERSSAYRHALDKLTEDGLLKRYPAPIKGGAVGPLHCLQWTENFYGDEKDLAAAFIRSPRTSWDVMRKATHTTEFLRHVRGKAHA